MRGTRRLFITVVTLATILASAAGAARAGKGGNGHHAAGGANTDGSSIDLVLVNSTDGLPHWGQQVTFAVSTDATDKPYVLLNCYQNGVWVYAAQAGFFPMFPFGTIFILSSSVWTSGEADCTATLGMNSDGGTRFTTLAAKSFHVDA